MKLWLIHLLDKFDSYILRHYFNWVCQLVSDSSWWGKEDCYCSYCSKIRENWLKLEKESENE
jgi:beta-galactosidase GanA